MNIRFAGNSTRITHSGERARKVIDFLYESGPTIRQVFGTSGTSSQSPKGVFHLEYDESEDVFQLFYKQKVLYFHSSEGVMTEYMQGEVCRHLATHGHGGLVLHAAALYRRGIGLLLPGKSGSGKTTLTAWLLTRGWRYMTDELVFIPHGSNNVQAFPRPLNFKYSARRVIDGLLDGKWQEEYVLGHPLGDLVRHQAFGSGYTEDSSPLNLALVPNYQADASFDLLPLSKAQAAMAFMECFINARNLSEHGFSEIVRLARAVPAYRLTYSHFDRLDSQLDELLHDREASQEFGRP